MSDEPKEGDLRVVWSGRGMGGSDAPRSVFMFGVFSLAEAVAVHDALLMFEGHLCGLGIIPGADYLDAMVDLDVLRNGYWEPWVDEQGRTICDLSRQGGAK